MSEVILDLSDYKDTTSARLPEGEYLVAVEDIEVGETRKGDAMWTVFLRVLGGEFDGSNLVDRLTQTPKALFRTVGFLQGLGVKTPKKRLKLNLNRLVGKKVRVQVADGDPYNGVVRSEIKAYVRYSAPSSASEDLSAETEDFETEADASAPAPTSEAPEKSAPATPSDTVDDLDLDLDDVQV